jgi:hypothetical protein
MTQPTTAPAGDIPAQRTTGRTTAGPGGGSDRTGRPTGWAAVRRALAILRGLHSLRTVPARPQPGYEECGGH